MRNVSVFILMIYIELLIQYKYIIFLYPLSKMSGLIKQYVIVSVIKTCQY